MRTDTEDASASGQLVPVVEYGIGAPAVLTEQAEEFARASMAPGTLRNYKAKWALWQAYCSEHGLPALPADPVHVANWLTHLAGHGETKGRRGRNRNGEPGQCVGTLRNALAGLRFAHAAADIHFDSRHPVIQRVLRGIARTKPEAPAQAEPLVAATLNQLLLGLDLDDMTALRDAAVIATGYAFGRRRSELIGLDLETMGRDADGVLKRGVRELTVELVRHKTAVASGEPLVLVVPRESNDLLVQIIETWITRAKIERATPLFRPVWRGGVIGDRRLLDGSIADAIKRRVYQFHVRRGLSPDVARAEAAKFSGHSMRVGLAVSAADAGADVRAIQTALAHKSPGMSIRYSERADKFKSSVHHLRGVAVTAKEPGGDV